MSLLGRSHYNALEYFTALFRAAGAWTGFMQSPPIAATLYVRAATRSDPPERSACCGCRLQRAAMVAVDLYAGMRSSLADRRCSQHHGRKNPLPEVGIPALRWLGPREAAARKTHVSSVEQYCICGPNLLYSTHYRTRPWTACERKQPSSCRG